jgi:hypothetical protein
VSGEKCFEVARNDAPFAAEIDRAQLLQFDPVTNTHLGYLKQVRDLLHRQEPSRQHRATLLRQRCLGTMLLRIVTGIDLAQGRSSVVECI